MGKEIWGLMDDAMQRTEPDKYLGLLFAGVLGEGVFTRNGNSWSQEATMTMNVDSFWFSRELMTTVAATRDHGVWYRGLAEKQWKPLPVPVGRASRVYQVATKGDTLFVASPDGLWIYSGARQRLR